MLCYDAAPRLQTKTEVVCCCTGQSRYRVDTERPVLQWPVVSALHGEKAPATFETGKEAFLFPFSSKIVKLTLELDVYGSKRNFNKNIFVTFRFKRTDRYAYLSLMMLIY